MDIVYVLNNTPSSWNDNEIKYSLRSLHKFGNGYERIFVIGGKPPFLDYNKIIHIDYDDSYYLAYNVFRKLLYLSNNTDVSEDFILFNDDFYLLEPIDLDKIPYYYKRMRIATIYANKNTYNQMALLTRNFLLKYKKSIYDFKVHYPIIYNKQKLNELTYLFNLALKTSPLSLSLRDLYGNWHDVPNKQFKKENKLMKGHTANMDRINKFVEGLDLFSSSNETAENEMNFLINNYPNKSKWEL